MQVDVPLWTAVSGGGTAVEEEAEDEKEPPLRPKAGIDETEVLKEAAEFCGIEGDSSRRRPSTRNSHIGIIPSSPSCFKIKIL